jgi:hypothetical protein
MSILSGCSDRISLVFFKKLLYSGMHFPWSRVIIFLVIGFLIFETCRRVDRGFAGMREARKFYLPSSNILSSYDSLIIDSPFSKKVTVKNVLYNRQRPPVTTFLFEDKYECLIYSVETHDQFIFDSIRFYKQRHIRLATMKSYRTFGHPGVETSLLNQEVKTVRSIVFKYSGEINTILDKHSTKAYLIKGYELGIELNNQNYPDLIVDSDRGINSIYCLFILKEGRIFIVFALPFDRGEKIDIGKFTSIFKLN